MKSIEGISFDVKFESFLFRKISKSDLSHILFDSEIFKTYIPNTFAKDSRFTKEEKETS